MPGLGLFVSLMVTVAVIEFGAFVVRAPWWLTLLTLMLACGITGWFWAERFPPEGKHRRD